MSQQIRYGRPPKDQRIIDEMVHLRKQGLGYKKIAQILNISPMTVRKYLKQMEQSEGERPPVAEPLPKPRPTKKKKKEMDEVYSRLSEYQVLDEDDSEISTMIKKLSRYERDIRTLKSKLKSIVEPMQPLEENEIETLKKKIDSLESEAKATLEKLGYKVTREDMPITEEEAKKLLEERGYTIQSRYVDRSEVDKLIEKEREKWEKEHNISLEERMEEKKIEGAERVVSTAIDKIVDIFRPAVSSAFGQSATQYLNAKEKMMQQPRMVTNPQTPPQMYPQTQHPQSQRPLRIPESDMITTAKVIEDLRKVDIALERKKGKRRG